MEQQFEPSVSDPLPAFDALPTMAPGELQAEELEARSQRELELSSWELDELLATLQQEAQNRRNRRRAFAIGVTLYLAIVIGAMISLTAATGKFPFIMISGISSMTAVVATVNAASKKQTEATKRLAQFDDVRAVGPLVDALGFQDKDTRNVAGEALVRLLPRLQASDASLLNVEQRRLLTRALDGKNQPLSLAILKALEQVGDEQSLPTVERLAKGLGPSALQQAARNCLPTLTMRVEHLRASAELLRAADGNMTPQGVLLRPAAATQTEIDPSVLLRSAASSTPPSGNNTQI